MSLSAFFKSKKSKDEETPEAKSESNFAKRSTMRKSQGMTPEDVINKRFGPTKFRDGYAQDEVDDFLDEVVAELRRLQKESKELKSRRANPELVIAATSSPILTPEEVVNRRFGATKFRGGYDQDEVDDFLDEIVVELRRLNAENQELADQIVAIVEETS